MIMKIEVTRYRGKTKATKAVKLRNLVSACSLFEKTKIITSVRFSLFTFQSIN